MNNQKQGQQINNNAIFHKIIDLYSTHSLVQRTGGAQETPDLILRSYRNYSDYCFTPSSRSFCFAKAKSSLTISALLRDSAKLRPTQNPPHQSAITRCPNWFEYSKFTVMLNLFQHLINCCFMLSLKIITDSSNKWTLIVVRLTFCNSLRKRSDCAYNQKLLLKIFGTT